MTRWARAGVWSLAALLAATEVSAGEADVISVAVERRSEELFDVRVTIFSNDRGWDYYADAFEVLTADGRLLGRRELLHPHENEQPFTREIEGLRVPRDVDRIVVRARHKPRGYDGQAVTIQLPR